VRTQLAERLGVDVAIFAFSHCRDVVAAVSKAGGFGVFGAGRYSPEELEIELRWLDENVGGRPYGVDVLMPKSIAGGEIAALEKQIPEGHRAFVADLVERFQIPAPRGEEVVGSLGSDATASRFNPNAGSESLSRQLLDVALGHKVALIASALGPPPADVVDEAHSKGLVVAGLVGEVRHARKHVDAGADIIVAVGSEGGGHVGAISTMVLVPAVVDEVGPLPVLAAGGIATGRQAAAALALGAQGVWCGSVWLTTVESDLDPILKQKIVGAQARDAVISRWRTGKTQRWLRTPWVDAWEEPGAPEPLPRALQTLLVRDATLGMLENRMADVMTTPAGQVIHMIDKERRCRDVVFDMAAEFIDAASSVSGILDDME